ncbi:hypothetical protein ACFVX3_32130 [Rhodococcus erythropolis]
MTFRPDRQGGDEHTPPRPTLTSPSFATKSVVVAVFGVLMVAALGVAAGFALGSADNDPDVEQAATSDPTPEATSSMDDWLGAICAPGTYSASSNVLKNSDTRPMSCRAPIRNGRAPVIAIGTYSSDFLLKEDMLASKYGPLAKLELTDGTMVIFALTSGASAPEAVLGPLRNFGFDVKI